jgi:glutaredoxin
LQKKLDVKNKKSQSMFKKITKLFLLTAILFLSFGGIVFAETDVNGEEEKVVIYLFDDRLCPVCKDAKDFIQGIQNDYPQVELRVYPVTDTEKLNEIAREHGINDYRIMAPTIFIGDYFFQFRDFTSRSEEMILGAIEGKVVKEDCCIIKIPFLNIEVDISNWSLPFIAMLLGSIDGLNVCSIGALILILSIVLVFKSKKKVFFFGGLFIFTSVVVYGTLVFIWGQLFEKLIGHLEILRTIIGFAVLGGAIYFFKEFYRFFKYGPTCKSSDSVLIKKATEKLQKAFERKGQSTLLLVVAVVSFAFVITIVELPCSIGIPIAFSGILVEAGITSASFFFYILLYLFFYMLIELIIFIGAVFTKQIWLAGSKAITWITFAGSMILFFLAFYYLIGF